MGEADPLLSAAGVSRLYGTGISTVTELVAESKLPTLDDGALIAAGRLDIPLIRTSWARALQRPSPGAERIIDPPSGALVHPAIEAAADFHEALQIGDSAVAYDRSSRASRRGRSPGELLARWMEIFGEVPEDSGISSVAYSLVPLPALAARVMAEAPLLPRVVNRPTPARMLAVLPMVLENGAWRVDLPLFEGSENLIELLAQPLPPDAASASSEES